MSGPGEGNGRGEEPPEGASVLANLPRTRPQRATPRRDAARRSAGAEKDDRAAANGNGRSARKAAAKPAKSGGGATRRTATTKAKQRPKAASARSRAADAVPRQGYESVEDRATGPVPPPGGTELLGTAAEIVSEVAKAGISGGERLLRDVFSRLGR